MPQGEGLVSGGGYISQHSQVRRSKVRKYQRKVDLRNILRPYQESPDPTRRDELCRQVAIKIKRKLKSCPPFVGTAILRKLGTVQNEDHLEHVLDDVWKFAEERRILLIA